MRTPTDEQQAVLDDASRIRVVRAAPGSGKTWLVAELIRGQLAGPAMPRSGIAALSFTRVGGEEIRQAVGHDLSHPHFVGTLDSFLFRYVVRPFAQQVLGFKRPPRLIPAESVPEHWKKGPGSTSLDCRGAGGQQAKTYNLFEICYTGEDSNGLVMACPKPYQAGFEPVSVADSRLVLAAKKHWWVNLGWLTHADAALIASELMTHSTHGASICACLAKRFSLVVVDEFQDTGYFLSKCVRTLLETPTSRGVLVGDPDQAIYEFNGARPDLFAACDTLSGAKALTLTTSLRCPSAIAATATHLKDSSGPLQAMSGSAGQTILVPYANAETDVLAAVAAVKATSKDKHVRVITRWNKTVHQLMSGKSEEIKSLRCPALVHLARGVQYLRQGDQSRALASARACVDIAVFEREGLSNEELQEKAVDSVAWKAVAVRCLLKALRIDSALSMQAWQVAAGKLLDVEIQAFPLPPGTTFTAGHLKPHNLTGTNRTKAKADTPFSSFAPVKQASNLAASSFSIETVHAVKGQTHDITIVVWPETKPLKCPSKTWWSSNADEREERRIAYVAMTRAKGALILCVPAASHARLLSAQQNFCDSFMRSTVADLATINFDI